MAKDELVAAVRKHAVENYESDGWDYVVECYSDAEIAEDIGEAETVAEAIRNVAEIVEALDDRRKDAQAEAW